LILAKKKSLKSLRRRFDARGVFVFVMTPFKSTKDRRGNYEPDLDGIARNAAYFSRIKGDKTLVICGGSGEFHSLSSAEVIALAEAAVAGVEGRCKIVAGVGGPDRTAVAMAQKARDVGCDVALVLPHPPVTQRGEKAIWERHRAIARATDIGLMPFRVGSQPLSPQLVERFAGLDNVVAIKEESNAVDWVRTGVRLTKGSIPIITGGGENMVPYYYLAGSIGFTTGMANVSLPQSVTLHNVSLRRNWVKSMEWRDYFEPLTDMRTLYGNAMLKAGLEILGLAGGPIRATGEVLDAGKRRKVRQLMEEKGLL
jgi:dihydrodipicolinate synthase/N-acetylneuraminate lyase